MLTPSWKLAAWNKKPAAPSNGSGVERSPELQGAGGAAVPGDAEWEHAEAQADRDWSAPLHLPNILFSSPQICYIGSGKLPVSGGVAWAWRKLKQRVRSTVQV